MTCGFAERTLTRVMIDAQYREARLMRRLGHGPHSFPLTEVKGDEQVYFLGKKVAGAKLLNHPIGVQKFAKKRRGRPVHHARPSSLISQEAVQGHFRPDTVAIGIDMGC